MLWKSPKGDKHDTVLAVHSIRGGLLMILHHKQGVMLQFIKTSRHMHTEGLKEGLVLVS